MPAPLLPTIICVRCPKRFVKIFRDRFGTERVVVSGVCIGPFKKVALFTEPDLLDGMVEVRFVRDAVPT